MTKHDRVVTDLERAELALRLARRCRQVVEDVLFNFEIAVIDREFCEVIADELRLIEEERGPHVT